MLATREQLVARWETPEGQQLAEDARRALDPVRVGQRTLRFNGLRTLDAALLAQVARLPFADEVKPSIDLRGLHVGTEDPRIGIKSIDLSHVRLDYAYEIDRIIQCRTDGAILDGVRSYNGMFTDATLTGISFVGASLNGGSFQYSDLSASHLQGAHLVKTDLSKTKCIGTNFLGADMRFADLRHADLSGADLREADLTEANFSAVTFTEQTRLQGANLHGAHLGPDFRAFAERSGALLTPRKTYHIKMMVEMEATARALQRYNSDGRYDDAIAALNDARELFRQNPDYSYSDGLDQAFARYASHTVWKEEVLNLWDEVSKALAYYL
jgi:uncharacterized protein YjbI with pentapeptide repeats